MGVVKDLRAVHFQLGHRTGRSRRAAPTARCASASSCRDGAAPPARCVSASSCRETPHTEGDSNACIGANGARNSTPSAHTNDVAEMAARNRRTNIHFGSHDTLFVSDSHSAHRMFSQKDMAAVKAVMSEKAKDDLRAVHLTLGTDPTVLDWPPRPHQRGLQRGRPSSAAY